jgi:hypothetical protein
MADFKIDWIDSGRESLQKSNPFYPDGQDIDASAGAQDECDG